MCADARRMQEIVSWSIVAMCCQKETINKATGKDIVQAAVFSMISKREFQPIIFRTTNGKPVGL